MDAIMFSANPSMVEVDDAIRHLADHEELYWEVGFKIKADNFSYPVLGFIHIVGSQVEYRATIRNIIPYTIEHYENRELAEKVKPAVWLQEWKDDLNNIRSHPWKYALVISEISPFSYDTYSFQKNDGTLMMRPPQGYTKVLPPSQEIVKRPGNTDVDASSGDPHQSEKEMEDELILNLAQIEPGLRLIDRQLRTPAGRLDLLCMDSNGKYVVIELKRRFGGDQVVGQILRYMGWLSDVHGAEQVRGIIIVGRKDQALSYALKAVANVQAEEYGRIAK